MPKHQPKERIYSLGFRELALRLGSEMSFHNAVQVINRVLHREKEEGVKARTYQDFCRKAGEEIETYLRVTGESILEQSGFDRKTGQPVTEEDLPAGVRKTGKQQEQETIEEAIQVINAERVLEEEQVKDSVAVIENPVDTCYISIDEIGVKHQKEQRKQTAEKQGAYVWNTVAVIQSAEDSYTLTGGDMSQTFRGIV